MHSLFPTRLLPRSDDLDSRKPALDARTRRALVRAPVAAVIFWAVLGNGGPTHASYLWEPRVQFTHAGTDSSHVTGDFIYGVESSTEYYHLAFRQWRYRPYPTYNQNSATGYYLRVPKSASWPDAWDDAWDDREQFTRQNEGNTNSMSDQRMAIDEEGDVHIAYEAKAYSEFGSGSHIGYKRRGLGTPQLLWDEDELPIPLFGPAYTCGGVTPRVFLQRLTGEDSLHVVFSLTDGDSASPCSGPLRRAHIAKEIGTADSTWSAVSIIKTEPFLGGQFVIDTGGTFHFLNTVEVDSSAYVLHATGTPPSGGGDWYLDSPMDVLDQWSIAGGIPITLEDAVEEPNEIIEGAGDVLYFVWNSMSVAADTSEIRMAQLDTSTGDWDPPLTDPVPRGIRLSGSERQARGAQVQINEDGVMHLTYHEPYAGNLHYPNEGSEARIFHRFNVGDPMDSTDWSAPTEISSDRRTDAKRPSIITDEDSVWVTYTIFDDDDDPENPDDAYEGWARRGYSIADSVASGEHLTWFGSVFLDADFVVAEGGTLSVDPGTTVFSRVDADRDNRGKESSLVELVVRGTLLADAGGEDPIRFTSYDEDGVGADEWGGLLMDIAGVYESSYGFFASIPPVSHLDNVEIENSAYGVRIANQIAPGLVDVTFTNIDQDRHIVLDSVDVVIPQVRAPNEDDEGPADYNGFEFDPYIDEAIWDLTGPVLVAATSGVHAAGDTLVYGCDTLATLIAQAQIVTHPGPSDERVVFSSMDGDSEHLGKDWDGIFIDMFAVGSDLNHAEVSYAKTGVMVYYGDDVTIECSHVHDFNETGVHVYGAENGGIVVDDNTIERGSGMSALAGDECLVVEQGDVCEVTSNLLELGSIQNNENLRTALRIQNTKIFCESAPTSSHSQVIEGNRILGFDFTASDSATGMLVNWGCAGANRTVTIDSNYIDEWPKIGAHFTECSGIDVGCNNVVNNTIGIKFERQTTTSGAAVDFHGNNIELADTTAALRAVEMRRPNQAEFGPSAASTGDNLLRIFGNSKLVYEQAPDDSVLDAQENYWYRDGTLQTNADSIFARITSGKEATGDSADVDISGFYTSLDDSCYVTLLDVEDVGCSGGGSRVLPGRPRPVVAQATVEASSRVPEVLVTGLGAVRPNPLSSSTTIELTVGTNNPGRYRLEIFDVQGRRVKTLLDGFPAPGRQEVSWMGRDRAGHHVAPGVYFVRMVAPGYAENKKVVLLR